MSRGVFPDTLFDLDFPNGTFVTDHVTGLRYMIGDAETEMLENLATVSDIFPSEMENTKISQITSNLSFKVSLTAKN